MRNMKKNNIRKAKRNALDKKKKEVIKIIKENYKLMENVMINEFDLASDHGGLSGHSRETMWMGFFRKIIPKKFSMEQGVKIIDAEGRVSNEVDIVVFDNQYTPYLFQYGTLKFIPIEAVAVVIECKSSNWTPNSLKSWYKSIDNLKTTPVGIARVLQGYSMAYTTTSQKATKPIKILASLREISKEKTIKPIENNFDIIIYEHNKGSEKSLEIKIPNEDKSLGWWGKRLNGIETEGNKNCKDVKDCEKCGHYKFDQSSESNDKEIPSNGDKFSEKGIIVEHLKENKEFLKLQEEHKYLTFCNKGYLTNKLSDFKVDTEEEIKNNDGIQPNQLLSLNFQLNQLLMLINNPMPFPHLAYVNLFKGEVKK